MTIVQKVLDDIACVLVCIVRFSQPSLSKTGARDLHISFTRQPLSSVLYKMYKINRLVNILRSGHSHEISLILVLPKRFTSILQLIVFFVIDFAQTNYYLYCNLQTSTLLLSIQYKTKKKNHDSAFFSD